MKKLFNLALFGAIALTGAVGFSSCSSSSDDEVINNPDFDPVTNTVKTTISLSINPNNGSSTRQSGTNVQSGGNFRGISNILSLPFTGDIATTTSTTGKLSWDAFSGFDGSSANYKLYANQNVVVGVDNFLFIGRDTATQSSVADKLAYGFTSNTLATASTVGDIQVTPGAMVTSEDLTTSNSTTKNWKYQSDALATYLTSIANAADATDASKKWSTTINPSLKLMYEEFTRTGTSTTLYNAGSAESVRLLLTDLLNKLDGITDASVSDIKTAIKIAIQDKATISGETNPYTVAWKTSGCEFVGFPTNLGLPEGSAQYMWDNTTSAFKYDVTNTLGSTTAVANFVFPNELYYLTKTPLRATSNATVEWPNTANNWAATTAPWTADTWTNAVAANSKNIALTYNINYGSALLATYVKAGATTLYDNARQLDPDKKGVATATNNAIVVKDGDTDKNPFELTGVLVGAQPDAVGWNFLPVSAASFNKVVYDGVMNGTINVTTTNNTTPNYTLLFDNYRDVSGDDLNVNVCLEFKNNMTSSFYGKDGIILPGQKFYIVGKLAVKDATTPLPADNGTTTDEALKAYIPNRTLRAFIQDYLTTANFTLTAGTANGNGDGSLAKAMTTIPDLRQSSQTIGLSVDLEWKSGVTYEVDLGGN